MEDGKMRRCTRCGGKMFIDQDIDGWYEQCINCSHRHELRVVHPKVRIPARWEREAKHLHAS